MLGLEINETLKDNPYFKKAMEYARMTDLSELPLGKHVLDSKNLWLTIIEMPLKAREEARLEAHDEYIDIQIPLSQDEEFGVKDAQNVSVHPGLSIRKRTLYSLKTRLIGMSLSRLLNR